jgi:predicted DNA-binding protein
MTTIDKVYKTSVNLPDVTLTVLGDIAKKRGKTLSQVIRDAIATEKILQDAVDDNAKILIKEKDGSIKQLIIR